MTNGETFQFIILVLLLALIAISSINRSLRTHSLRLFENPSFYFFLGLLLYGFMPTLDWFLRDFTYSRFGDWRLFLLKPGFDEHVIIFSLISIFSICFIFAYWVPIKTNSFSNIFPINSKNTNPAAMSRIRFSAFCLFFVCLFLLGCTSLSETYMDKTGLLFSLTILSAFFFYIIFAFLEQKTKAIRYLCHFQ